MPNRFDFRNCNYVTFTTITGLKVKLYRQTWFNHIINARKREHLDLNRQAIVDTIESCDHRKQSQTEPDTYVHQKQIPLFHITDSIRVPAILVAVIDERNTTIKTIYDAKTFK